MRPRMTLRNNVSASALIAGVGGGGPSYGGGASGFWDLIIPAGMTDSDLTDFPVRIELGQLPTSFWNETNAGLDVRAWVGTTEGAGGTEIPTDLIYFDGTNFNGHIWVKVPTLSAAATTIITLKADGVSTRPAAGDANGQYAVWSDYECVYIPDGSTFTNRCDGTTGTTSGTQTAQTVGATTADKNLAGSKYSHDNTGAGNVTFSVADVSTSSGVFSYGVAGTTQDTTQDAFGSYGQSSGFTEQATFVVDNGDQCGLFDVANSWVYPTGNNIDPESDEWIRGVVKYNGTTERKLIVSGDQSNMAVDTTITSMSGQSLNTFVVGGSSASQYLNGEMGYSWLRLDYVSDDWATAEFNMLMNPLFARYGNLVNSGALGTNVNMQTGDTTGWTLNNVAYVTCEDTVSGFYQGTVPFSNTYYFQGGTTGVSGNAKQTIDVSGYSTEIDAGRAFIQWTYAPMKDFDDTDKANAEISFKNAGGTEISAHDGARLNTAADNAVIKYHSVQIPPLTRDIEILIRFSLLSGLNVNCEMASKDFIVYTTPDDFIP